MKKVALTLILILTVTLGYAQSIEELRRQIQEAENEIKITNQLLSKTRKQQTANLGQLQLVRNNISNRKKIIANLDRQIVLINSDVRSKNGTVNELRSELAKLKKDYAKIISTSYRNYKLNNYITFLFASKNFNDITRRISYLKRYTAMRERKAEAIDSMRSHLSSDITELKTKKAELDLTIKSRNTELTKLSEEEQEYRKIDTSLINQTSKYNTNIANKRKAITNLQTKIQKIIEEEAKKSKNTKRTTLEQEAFIKLSGRFDQNIRKLPYPISGGVIIDRYGKHPHPTEKGVTINNTGINIAAEKGAFVRAVFEGEVSRVLFIPGFNNTVMIRHGNYLTVYSNLESVSIKAGDNVSTNQIIGKIYSGDDVTNYILHFEVWKETQNLNPENWLRR